MPTPQDASRPGLPSQREGHPDIAAETARRLRQLGEDAGAAEFSLFLVSPAAEGRRLTPFLDASHPLISKRTEMLALALGERLARRAVANTQPFWWAGDDGSPIAMSLTRCLWAERIAAPRAAAPALALPLVDECEQAGLVVLSGERVAVSMQALADMQARCLALFCQLTRLRASAARALPPISRRELECLRLTANGQTSEEIAARLGLSVHTANQYLTNSTQKLNAMNRMHAVAKALRLGLID
jgi:DNA-binding CsgD family transcriptional regulator